MKVDFDENFFFDESGFDEFVLYHRTLVKLFLRDLLLTNGACTTPTHSSQMIVQDPAVRHANGKSLLHNCWNALQDGLSMNQLWQKKSCPLDKAKSHKHGLCFCPNISVLFDSTGHRNLPAMTFLLHHRSPCETTRLLVFNDALTCNSNILFRTGSRLILQPKSACL